jgi:hypothetical protein
VRPLFTILDGGLKSSVDRQRHRYLWNWAIAAPTGKWLTAQQNQTPETDKTGKDGRWPAAVVYATTPPCKVGAFRLNLVAGLSGAGEPTVAEFVARKAPVAWITGDRAWKTNALGWRRGKVFRDGDTRRIPIEPPLQSPCCTATLVLGGRPFYPGGSGHGFR